MRANHGNVFAAAPPVRRRTPRRVSAFVFLTAAIAVLASAAFAQERQMTDTIIPEPTISAAQMMVMMQLYHMATLALWLAWGGFIAGLLVGAVVRRRAGAWAVGAMAVFLAVMMAAGAGAAPARVYLPIVLAGILLVLSAAAFGGWIGERLWGSTRRPAIPGN